mmetsp:Transcript_67503/g.126246  ORF Transcript_67503/g.126246 Transcript_67503/m.126246 type:complete len:340 (+) Transcript_67503:448-1467(+)
MAVVSVRTRASGGGFRRRRRRGLGRCRGVCVRQRRRCWWCVRGRCRMKVCQEQRCREVPGAGVGPWEFRNAQHPHLMSTALCFAATADGSAFVAASTSTASNSLFSFSACQHRNHSAAAAATTTTNTATNANGDDDDDSAAADVANTALVAAAAAAAVSPFLQACDDDCFGAFLVEPQTRRHSVLQAFDLEPRQQLCLELVRREHCGERDEFGAVNVNEFGGNVKLAVVAQHRIAHVHKVWVTRFQLRVCRRHGTQKSHGADVTREQVRRPSKELVRSQARHENLELLPVENLPFESSRVASMVAELDRVHEIHIEPKKLKRKHSALVPNVTMNYMTLN